MNLDESELTVEAVMAITKELDRQKLDHYIRRKVGYAKVADFVASEIRARFHSELERIVIRDVPYEQAKKEVHDYVLSHGLVWPGDMVQDLQLDLEVIMRAVKELMAEGKA